MPCAIKKQSYRITFQVFIPFYSGVVTQGCDGIAEVRMGPQHGIHKSTKGMLVGFDRDFRGLKLNKVLIGEG